MSRKNTTHEITTKEDVIEAINKAMIEKEKIKEGGIKYFIRMYEGTNLLPHPNEIKRIMLCGEGYYY